MSQQITIELPQAEAEALISALATEGVAVDQADAARLTGEALFVVVLLPVALTAVQVAATFLAARRQKPPAAPETPAVAPARIRIGSMTIGDTQFTIEAVEKAIGKPLDDA